MRSTASSAVARSSATTAQIASPQNRTLSTASQCCTDSPPEKRFGMLRNGSTLPSNSLPVSTLMTPGSFRASLTSTELSLAWACWLRRNATWYMPGSLMSLRKRPSPSTSGIASSGITDEPTIR